MDFMEQLECFCPKQKDGYVEIALPVVFFSSHGCILKFCITEKDDGYMIACVQDLFHDANATQAWYFNIFLKHDTHYHYEMRVDNNVIYKEYPKNRSLVTALDEFVRFFILFDDFIMENNVIGNEENFE